MLSLVLLPIPLQSQFQGCHTFSYSDNHLVQTCQTHCGPTPPEPDVSTLANLEHPTSAPQEHVPNPRNNNPLIPHPPSNQTPSTDITFNTFELSLNKFNDFHPGDLETISPPISTSQSHQLQPAIVQLVSNFMPPPPCNVPLYLTSLFMPNPPSAMPMPTFQAQHLYGLDSQYENGKEDEGGIDYSASLHFQNDQPITCIKSKLFFNISVVVFLTFIHQWKADPCSLTKSNSNHKLLKDLWTGRAQLSPSIASLSPAFTDSLTNPISSTYPNSLTVNARVSACLQGIMQESTQIPLLSPSSSYTCKQCQQCFHQCS